MERFQDFRYPLGPAAFDTLEDKPAHQREGVAAERARSEDGYISHPLYFGWNSFIDHEYGRLVEAVERYAPENTYIILTTDHGEMSGAHGLWGKGPVMYQEITHVPFIIRQPDGKGAGISNSTPVSHIDILPTMLELAGLEIPPILEGGSLVPYLDGTQGPDREVVIEFNRYEIEHEHHDHLVCVKCGKIIEFECEAIEASQNEIAERYDFQILRHRHELYGYCAACRSEVPPALS